LKSKKKHYSDSNRRQWPRLKPSAVPFLKSVTFSRGSEVQVIDISRGGILLETEVRLSPGTKVFLKLVTSEGVLNIEGLTLRSSVSSLKKGPLYRSAIAFECPFDMLQGLSDDSAEQPQESESKAAENGMIDTGVSRLSRRSGVGSSQLGENSATLTVIAKDGMSLKDMLELNEW
jgi:hypothetical protein